MNAPAITHGLKVIGCGFGMTGGIGMLIAAGIVIGVVGKTLLDDDNDYDE